jgi:hypothetical protein
LDFCDSKGITSQNECVDYINSLNDENFDKELDSFMRAKHKKVCGE